MTMSSTINNNLQALLMGGVTLSSDDEDDSVDLNVKPAAITTRTAAIVSKPFPVTPCAALLLPQVSQDNYFPTQSTFDAIIDPSTSASKLESRGTLASHLLMPEMDSWIESRADAAPLAGSGMTNSDLTPSVSTLMDYGSHRHHSTVSEDSSPQLSLLSQRRRTNLEQTRDCLLRAPDMIAGQPPAAVATQFSPDSIQPTWISGFMSDSEVAAPFSYAAAHVKHHPTDHPLRHVAHDLAAASKNHHTIQDEWILDCAYANLQNLKRKDRDKHSIPKEILDDSVKRQKRQDTGYDKADATARETMNGTTDYGMHQHEVFNNQFQTHQPPFSFHEIATESFWEPAVSVNEIFNNPAAASTVSPPLTPIVATTRREVDAQENAIHAVTAHLGAYQRQILDTGAQTRQHHSIRGLEAIVDNASPGSSVTKLAGSRWTKELLGTIDPIAAFHLGRFITGDPDPNTSVLVQQMAQQMLNSQSEVEKTPTGVTFVDLSDESDRNLFLTEIDSLVSGAAERLEIPTEAASLLLHDFSFNLDQATESTSADRQGTLERLGLALRCSKKRKAPETRESLRSCGICFDDLDDGARMFCLPCHHDFCIDCWNGYILNALRSGGLMRLLTTVCPSPDCKERFTVDDALKISPELSYAWHRAYLNAYVERSQRRRRFCPGPDCGMIAVAPPEDDSSKVSCLHATCTHCKTCFCMQCGELKHIPAKCEDFDKFQSMLGSSCLWLKKNTKPCPGCNSSVEKNGGCNAMSCTRCFASFCWLCLSLVDGHMPHTCNKVEPVLNVTESEFEFFAKRFQAHKEAEENAREQLKYWQQNNVSNSLASETGFRLHDQDTATFCKALETLVDARNFLKNSCAASYARKTNLAFEMHQASLEASTEGLNSLTGVYVEKLNDEGGEQRVRKHFGMVGLHTLFVVHCLKRMKSLAGVL